MGTVFLVGAGPGARDLITVRGLQCLRQAQSVLYDRLASPELLDEIPAEAERLYVGKEGGKKTCSQEAIGELLVQRARKGLRVVRLKGGDPFVFGRGGEEAAALAAAGVPFEVVPGISSAIAAPAYAGIPVTQRGMAEGVQVLTGHLGRIQTPLTAVVLMGLRRLQQNVELLLAQGYRSDTPAALIQDGTLPSQRKVVATLATISDVAGAVASPAVLVVGPSVALHQQLGWFERRPLHGVTVLVTRAREQAGETCRLLEARGARTVAMPTIAIRPPSDPRPLEQAVAQLQQYDLVVFTSANAVTPLRECLERQGRDARAFAGVTLCAIGPGTARALSELGLRPDLVPEDHRGEGLVELLSAHRVRGKRVLIPRAAVARSLLPDTLQERGAQVSVVPVYETGLPDPQAAAPGLRALEQGQIDVLSFTSASTVHNFAALCGDQLQQLAQGRVVVAIGPVTRDACLEVGLQVDVMPERYTLPAMVEALVRHHQHQLNAGGQ